MTNQTRNQPGKRGQWARSWPVRARTSSTRARGMIRFRARSRSRVGQDAQSVGLLADVDHRSLLTSHGVVANSMLAGGFLVGNPVGRYRSGIPRTPCHFCQYPRPARRVYPRLHLTPAPWHPRADGSDTGSWGRLHILNGSGVHLESGPCPAGGRPRGVPRGGSSAPGAGVRGGHDGPLRAERWRRRPDMGPMPWSSTSRCRG